MQVYGRGLRRRLPPMLDGDPRRIRMVYSLLFSLPGTPVLFYGEEIGMGEDLDVEGRLAVRTPMQWTVRPQRRLLRAPRRAGCAGPVVERRLRARVRQRRRPAARPRLAAGVHEAADPAVPGVAGARLGRASRCSTSRTRQVLAHACVWDDGTLVAVHNLGAEPRTVPLTLEDCDSHAPAGRPAAGRQHAGVGQRARSEVALEGYGYRWLRVVSADSRRLV